MKQRETIRHTGNEVQDRQTVLRRLANCVGAASRGIGSDRRSRIPGFIGTVLTDRHSFSIRSSPSSAMGTVDVDPHH